MTEKSLSGLLVLGTAISGIVGGVCGGLVVLFGASLSPASEAPHMAPTPAVQDDELRAEVPPPTDTGSAEAEPLELEQSLETPAPKLPSPPPSRLETSPADEPPPYELGFAVPATAVEFVRQELRLACEGNVDSMLRTSEWIAEGSGVPQSAFAANTWLRRARACVSGVADDPATLRVIRAHAAFLVDPGGPGWANPEGAYELLRATYDANPAAHGIALDLAALHKRGRGTPYAPDRAYALVRGVADQAFVQGEQGFAGSSAYATLAEYLSEAVGVGQDLDEAALWVRRSVESQPDYLVNDRDFVAVFALYAKLETVPGGVVWLRHYTAKSAGPAFFLARCYEEGTHGVPADREQAISYYRAALKLKHAHAAEGLERLGALELEATGD